MKVSETAIQMSFVQEMRYKERGYGLDYFFFTHAANEGLFTVQHRVKLCKMGVMNGFPDIVLFFGKDGQHRMMFIEFKRNSKDARLSNDQKKFYQICLDNDLD